MNTENKQHRIKVVPTTMDDIKHIKLKYRSRAKYKIVALCDMPDIDVHEGESGGFVESPDNIDTTSNVWMTDNTVVTDSAYLSGYIMITGYTTIEDNTKITGNCLIHNSNLFDDTVICGKDIFLSDSKILGKSVISGNVSCVHANINDSHISDNASIVGQRTSRAEIEKCIIRDNASLKMRTKKKGFPISRFFLCECEVCDNAQLRGRVTLFHMRISGNAKLEHVSKVSHNMSYVKDNASLYSCQLCGEFTIENNASVYDIYPLTVKGKYILRDNVKLIADNTDRRFRITFDEDEAQILTGDMVVSNVNTVHNFIDDESIILCSSEFGAYAKYKDNAFLPHDEFCKVVLADTLPENIDLNTKKLDLIGKLMHSMLIINKPPKKD